MFKALFKILSLIFLAIAVMLAVSDAARSIAAERLVLTPLGASWMSWSPATLESLEQAFADNLPVIFWDPAMIFVLQLPGAAVFAGLALLCAAAGGGRARDRRINPRRGHA